ncbi:restriction endonuclease [Malaciobacter marinus]|uniref:nSTAND3 domain-containing NTPase n=1 Tax=Malaciobacter marinus TaxID=505249 RepID=UPI003B007F53
MTDYDFSILNDKEFENISIELVSINKEKRFERFKGGRDGGIDGRFYSNNGKQEVIQCKHYLGTGFSGLITSLKKKNANGINEIDKVSNLNPEKYIFTTSLPLSAENKKTIKDLFKPFIKNDNDIYGQEDLNDILSQHSKIEEKYYKLWISSTTVLKRMFNNAINGRSEALVEEIKDNTKYYVITENHNKALKKINNTNIIIIAGEPGIGKTTLAEHIALYYIEKDFEFYDIENSINEAENIFNREKKQVFYFDDFLGSNYLEAIESKKDSHIMRFIERIKKDKKKRFILTSRTNIFNQGILLSDTFSSKNIKNTEFIIKIDSLKDMDKARILYNHIWHSDLSEEYKDVLYYEKRYIKIIKHKNFNPRIISFITNMERIKKEKVPSNDYWTYIVSKLENPKDIWKNTFDKQSDEFTRSLVILTVLNGNKINETKLRDSFNQYNKLIGLQNPSHISKEFDSIIEEVVKYFLNRTQNYDKTIEYTLFNPSIADFILFRYQKDNDKLLLFYKVLNNIDSINELFSLKNSGKIDEETYYQIVIELYKNIDILKITNIDYVIKLFLMAEMIPAKKIFDKKKTVFFLQNIIDNFKSFQLIDTFVTLITYYDEDELTIRNNDFILELIDNLGGDENDINKIIELIKHFDINDKKVNEELNLEIHKCLEYGLDNVITDMTSDDVEIESLSYEETFVNDDDFDSVIKDNLEELINSIDSFEGISIDKNSILSIVDYERKKEDLVYSYLNNSSDEYDHKDVISNSTDNIDDLFER